jgi:hypothetical protein
MQHSDLLYILEFLIVTIQIWLTRIPVVRLRQHWSPGVAFGIFFADIIRIFSTILSFHEYDVLHIACMTL